MENNKQLVFEKDGKLITDSLVLAREFEKEHKNVLADISNQINKLIEANEEEFSRLNFQQSDYINERGRKYQKFDLTEEAYALIAMSYVTPKAMKAKVKFINEFNRMRQALQNTSKNLLPTTYKEALLALVEQVEANEKLEADKKLLEVEITHKEDVIIGLVDEISLAEKRQILNRVVRKGGLNKVQDRWGELYKQFGLKYHLNLKLRYKKYKSNKENKPKVYSKLEYIDKVMNKLPELYEIACKLYENDVKELVKEMYELNSAGERELAEIQ
ncbi:Rha family transcriptional regulator [Paenibacillus peoriae]|uniref:Rha family transcriptional regulator n=1 Tax=Paenibacillus peoriae TaxID=59893 RepID=A0A7H0Y330_9BACL|nr:Rha family transcriptional regulator [Paenibacillus peoriae]QNR65488.1 Rha family transcriptional regulator [Paenibacillus peoriae]